ncbi:unnamed protein product [Calypogeia fissa]
MQLGMREKEQYSAQPNIQQNIQHGYVQNAPGGFEEAQIYSREILDFVLGSGPMEIPQPLASSEPRDDREVAPSGGFSDEPGAPHVHQASSSLDEFANQSQANQSMGYNSLVVKSAPPVESQADQFQDASTGFNSLVVQSAPPVESAQSMLSASPNEVGNSGVEIAAIATGVTEKPLGSEKSADPHPPKDENQEAGCISLP